MSGSTPDCPTPQAVAAVRQLRAGLENQLSHARSALYETRCVVGDADPSYVAQAQFVAEIEERIAVIDRQVPEARPAPGPVRIIINGKFYGGARDFTVSHDLAHAELHREDTNVEVAVQRAIGWLQFAELFVSPRVAREEIGDLLEMIHRYVREGRPRWHIYVRAITGAVLAIGHTWGDKLAAVKKIGG